jgi:hypothetical protein
MHLDIRHLPFPARPAFLLTLGLLAACDRPHGREAAHVQALEPIEIARSAAGVEFSQVTDVGVDSHQRIYVGDGLGEIMVLDENGALLRRLGGMGAGPGEFQSVGTIHLLPGDSLYVYDGAAQRATVYVPDGERVAYTIRIPQPDVSFAMDVEPLREGRLIAHFRRISSDAPGGDEPADDVIRLLNRDGSVLRDTLLSVPQPEILKIRNGERTGFFLPPFARQSLVRWGADGRIYWLWTDSARVRIHDDAGRERGGFTASLKTPRIPLADATIDSIVERNAAARIPPRTLREAFRARWRTWPLVEDMLVDDRSRVWIRPVTPNPLADWLAFDAHGAQVAAFRLPATVRPRLIRGDRLYAVSRDSLDVESLIVYRLAPTSTPERP